GVGDVGMVEPDAVDRPIVHRQVHAPETVPSQAVPRDNQRLITGSEAAMLDPNLLRQQPAELADRLRQTRGFDLDAQSLEALEAERKQIQVRTQELQNLRNTRSKAIGQAKAKGEDVAPLMAEVAGFGDELKASEARLDAIKAELEA